MKLQVIIWDEASMIHKTLFEIVSSLIQDIYKGNNSHFNGSSAEFPVNPIP